MALLKFKRSAVPAKVPSIADLALGELAINTYDGKVYTKKDNGTQAIVEVGGGGGVQTITSSDGSVTVTGTTDINLSVPVTAATNTVILPVRNNTGATLAKGTAVYINGALGQNPTVTKAIATGDATSAQTLGLVTADINNNAVGNVTLIGSLTNLDTSAYTDGAQLYLSPTTAGALTATKPYAPNHLVYMAVVEHAHPALGKLFVKVQNGYEMDELHNVAAQSPANNDGLFYNTSTSLWEKKSIATALGYTPYNATNPSGYITSSSLSPYLTSTTAASTYQPLDGDLTAIAALAGTTGLVRKTAANTYSLDTATYLTGITSGQVTTALGFTPYNATNPAGYITSSASITGNAATVTSITANTGLGRNSLSAGIVDGLTTTNFRTTMFGNAAATYNIATSRWNSVPTAFSGLGPYGTAIAWSGNDTHAFLALNFNSAGAKIGGGNSDNINWSADLLHSANYTSYAMPSGSSATNSVDVRAPIFYDSNNTAYYVDPASTSNLNALNLASGSVLGAAVTFNNMNQPHTTYTDANNVVSFGFRYLQGGTNGPAISGASQYYGMTLGLGNDYGLDGYGSQFYWPRTPLGGNPYPSVRFREGGTWGAWSKIYAGWADAPSGSTFVATGDFRAPIFYDSGNTAYYLDPAGTSNLSGITMNGTFTGVTGRFQKNQTAGDYTTAALWTESYGSTATGIAFHISGIVGKFLEMRTDQTLYWPGTMNASGDFRAPIFYDSQNTGYYVDPNSTSNLVGLTVANTISGSVSGSANVANFLNGGASSIDADNITNRVNSGFWQSSTGTTAEGWPINDSGWQHMISATHSNTGNYFAMQLAAGFFSTGLFYRSVNNNGAQAWSRVALYGNGYAAPLYANVYYDADNTTYYLDPSTNGTSLNVAGAIVAGGNITAYSDIRIKANVETIPSALDKLDQIRGVTYTRTDLEDKEQRYAGVIAQEIEAVLPEAVRDLGNIKAVDYNATIALLIQAVKELRDEVEALRK